MTEPHDELLQFADRLDRLAERGKEAPICEPLNELEEAATEVGKAWSGSWIGYHANVYYADLAPPPPGVHFSSEWGLRNPHATRRQSDWQEFDSDELESAIHKAADDPDLNAARRLTEEANTTFGNDKSEILSILTAALAEREDSFLEQLKDEIYQLSVLSRAAVIRRLRPSSGYTSRDSLAMHQGLWTPPHLSVLSEVISLRNPPDACGRLSNLARKAGSHLLRQQRQRRKSETVGTNVFIGHGRSSVWRELKDFVEKRLKLPVDEFNRVPIAGLTNIARLSEMLESAAIAFLIMTGEDEQPDGTSRARMNVVHEAGCMRR